MKSRCRATAFKWMSSFFTSRIFSPVERKRFQYTAIDDATRARALYIYDKHTQANAIDFVDKIREKFPFPIHTIQTDNGHGFQALFHWHCEDLGIRHVYIKKASPHLNGKVERSHLTNQTEFYQLGEYVDDIDILKKPGEWETFLQSIQTEWSSRWQNDI
jgi:transposase InsO family protein